MLCSGCHSVLPPHNVVHVLNGCRDLRQGSIGELPERFRAWLLVPATSSTTVKTYEKKWKVRVNLPIFLRFVLTIHLTCAQVSCMRQARGEAASHLPKGGEVEGVHAPYPLQSVFERS